MDPKTKELVEAAEKRAEAAVGASWVLPDASYEDFRAHKAIIAALCAVIRERAARLEQIARLAATADIAIASDDVGALITQIRAIAVSTLP